MPYSPIYNLVILFSVFLVEALHFLYSCVGGSSQFSLQQEAWSYLNITLSWLWKYYSSCLINQKRGSISKTVMRKHNLHVLLRLRRWNFEKRVEIISDKEDGNQFCLVIRGDFIGEQKSFLIKRKETSSVWLSDKILKERRNHIC